MVLILVMHLGWTKTCSHITLCDRCFLEQSLVARFHPAKIVSLVGAPPAFACIGKLAKGMLSKACLEDDIRLGAAEIANETSAVTDNV